MVLESELQIYLDRKHELLGVDDANEGRYTVISGGLILGVYPTRADALEAGYLRFGDVPFLVKKIERDEPVYRITRGFF